MAPKRKIFGKETRVLEDYNRTMFVRLEAQKRFENATKLNKKFIVEKRYSF